jgi:DNA-binding LacI/PurR family transcriptional regulator
VPEDISVVGFDDIPESAFFLPPLTTVRQDFGELGRRALRRLLSRISESDGPAPQPQPGPWTPVPPELVMRASAAGPGS